MPIKTIPDNAFGSSIALRRKVNRIQESVFRQNGTGHSAPQPQPFIQTFEPRGNVSVKTGPDGSLQLIARLPGLQAHEIDIEVDDRSLTLMGERRKAESYLRRMRDRRHQEIGPFRRTFDLPTGVTRDQVVTRFKEDVLTVTIPRPD
jgi:HSP20 family protein